jgi:hypothetical protein
VAVGVEDRVHPLQQHRAPLEPEPRVDVLLRQRGQRPVGRKIELHEDEVPELDVAVAALAVRPAVRVTAAVLGAAVVVELGARAARPGLPGGAPEVVGAREGHDPLARDPLAQPRTDGDLVHTEAETGVTREHGGPQALGLEAELVDDELPGVIDRTVLEVVTEREVAEHLEHRRVAGGQPDLVEIGVLAAGAQALLHRREARCGRLLGAGEVRLQRLHPGGDEQRGRILGRRDQRPRREAHVPALLEEREKALAELGCRAHAAIVAAVPCGPGVTTRR